MKQWQVLKTVFPEVITDNFEFTGDEESECMPMSAAALTRMLRYRRATADESKKESITFVILSFAWCHQESNRGHKDFQSFALPTELWHLAFVCECKGIANFITVQIFLIKFLRIKEGEIAKKAASR